MLEIVYIVNMKVKVAQSCPTLCDPVDYTVHGILQVRILEWVAFPLSGDLPKPRIEPRTPALQGDSLPAQPPEKPKNTGMGSLSLLQQIFPIPGIELGFPALQADSLLSEPLGKPKHTGMGSLSLLQGIFPTTEPPGRSREQAF